MRPLSKPSTPPLTRPARWCAPVKKSSLLGRYSQPQMVKHLQQYQAELEIQNQALRYSQVEAEGASERFVTLFSNVPLALMVVDEDSLVLESNAMALGLFRPREEDAPLNFLLPLVSTQHQAKVADAFAQAMQSGTGEAHEIVFASGSAGFFTGDLHIARIENTHDELAHFICAIIDQGPLLAQRRALQASAAALQERNEELNQSKNRLAAIINSSLDAIVGVDQDHRITVFNPAAEALFECPAEQALGSAISRFLPKVPKALPQAQTASQAQLGEMTGLNAHGETVAVEVSVSFEGHPEGDTTTIFARDLRARKKMEAHRIALESQLRESQKMQAVGTMAGGIAHDFNNIISAILGNVDLARQDAGPNSPALVSLSEIDKAARRARDLVRQILTFSRNESPKRTPIQLADVVQETARLLKVSLPPTVELRLNIAPNAPYVLADATQVEQALLNLGTNAMHAIGSAHGTISLALGFHQDTSNAERRTGVRGQHVWLAVSDTGSGIDAETLERVFEPFFTTKPVGQGTGLGLAVVHGVMRTHMGTVDVQSTPGQGTTFTLYFPIAESTPEPVVAEPPKPKAVQASGQHLMYVDDDEALVFLIQRALKRKGFAVTTFTDPRLAVATLRENPQAFDLLVTDYNMPGYSGLELLREVREIRPELPVALASGYVTTEIEHSAMAAGARALIYKPNDVDEMCQTLQGLLKPDHASD
jgi:two-component system, cell cycle sensor histidine kinase and response regulator CckA